MSTSARLGGMVPSHLPEAHATDHLDPMGRLSPADRARLRRIPSWRNAVTVVWLWGQTLLVLVLAVRISHPATWVVAFLMMGRAHAQFASLMHEAAHRLLFRHKGVNDFVGIWFLGFPAMTSTQAYRRVHMAHHRREFGPDEPDIPLYANYPISSASMRRKLVRDATGRTGLRLLRNQMRGLRSPDPRVRSTLLKMLGVQTVLIGASVASGHPWLWPLLWVLPHLTVWRVINRMRSIAEHGGMREDDDRRFTTHSVAQHPLAMFFMVPYKIGFHMAHHVDAGVPFRNLPEYHRLLHEANYLDRGLEYPSYRALWRALAPA
ncbi:MAG: fatty acid desaturase [Acidimicrobiales bacterium]